MPALLHLPEIAHSTLDLSQGHWSASAVGVNLFFVINMLGALALGMIVGYERAFHGRAAGMRTYALVCMASCAVTIIAGYPDHWFGGLQERSATYGLDPTRVIQGVLTGIGFLCAGVITKDGANISGLTTAASIWTCSAIGLLLGMGFYAAAIAMTVLSAGIMAGLSAIEQWLPTRHAIAVTIRFRQGQSPTMEDIARRAGAMGYEIAEGNAQIRFTDGEQEWQLVAVSRGSVKGSIAQLSQALAQMDSVREFRLAHARN